MPVETGPLAHALITNTALANQKWIGWFS